MSHISRRKVVKGAAWATPVIAASAVVPAYAASKPDCTVSENLTCLPMLTCISAGKKRNIFIAALPSIRYVLN